MLGSGRPFILQLVNPKKRASVTDEQLRVIEQRLQDNPNMSALGLEFCDEKSFLELKDSEETKVKIYCCLVETSSHVSDERFREIEQLKDIVIDQKTPMRVLHRRSNMSRDKTIHRLKVHRINELSCLVFVFASAGTYIKEFIHGDLGRYLPLTSTFPNFGSLTNTKADIYQLDVLDLFSQYDEHSQQKFFEICDFHTKDL